MITDIFVYVEFHGISLCPVETPIVSSATNTGKIPDSGDCYIYCCCYPFLIIIQFSFQCFVLLYKPFVYSELNKSVSILC